MKELSVADLAMIGVLAIGGYSVYQLVKPKHPNTIDDCAKLLMKLPEPYHSHLLDDIFGSKKRGVELSNQIDAFALLLDKDGFEDEAKCVTDYKAQITSDIESTEIVPES